MGIKDMGKAIVTTGAGLVSPLHGMGAVLLTETMDYFYQSYIGVKRDKAQKFYDEFQKWLNNELVNIDREFLETPYFTEILEIILVKAASSSNEWKIKKFREILENEIKGSKINDHSRTYLDILEKLTEKEFEILKFCFENQEFEEEGASINKDKICKELELDDSEYLLNITHLEGKALIIERTYGRTTYNVVTVSLLGENFIKFIKGE